MQAPNLTNVKQNTIAPEVGGGRCSHAVCGRDRKKHLPGLLETWQVFFTTNGDAGTRATQGCPGQAEPTGRSMLRRLLPVRCALNPSAASPLLFAKPKLTDMCAAVFDMSFAQCILKAVIYSID